MNWEDRVVKQQARQWLLEKIPNNSKNGINYAGLSAGEAIFEKMLCASRKVRSLSMFELDSKIFDELTETRDLAVLDGIFPLSSYVVNHSIDDFVKSNLSVLPQDVLWLDYCGPITQDRLDSLKIGLSRRPRGGIVAVTFMACREPKTSTALIDDLVDNTPWDLDAIQNVPAYFLRKIRAVSSFALQADRNLKIEALPYKDGAPMMLIVFSDSAGRPTIEVEPYLKE